MQKFYDWKSGAKTYHGAKNAQFVVRQQAQTTFRCGSHAVPVGLSRHPTRFPSR
jgi:hypothetical protein